MLPIRLEAERFSAKNTEPKFFEGERQKTALREALEIIQLNGVQGQRFDSLLLNRDFIESGNPLILWIPGMFEDVRGLGLRYTGYQLAVNNPENPILLINLPAHGNSDSLTREQRNAMRKDRNLDPLVESQLRAAINRLKNVEKLVLGGQSAGAMLAPDLASVARELGLEPEALIGFLMMRADKRPSIATTTAYVWDGYINQYKYHQSPDDKKLDIALEEDFAGPLRTLGFRDEHNAIINDINIFRNDPSYLSFLFLHSPLSQDRSFAAIERALELNPKMAVAIVSGGIDKVSRWRKLKPRSQQLIGKYNPRMSWNCWPYDGHAMGIAPQQPRHAKVVRYVIDSLREQA